MLEKYDGTSYPEEHVDIFTTQVGLYTNNDALLCRTFPTSLCGPAFNWFTGLLSASIDSFVTLVTHFNLQFATSHPHQLTSLALVNIRQEKKETLKTFMEHFGQTTLSIRNLDPTTAMHHLTTALRPRTQHSFGLTSGEKVPTPFRPHNPFSLTLGREVPTLIRPHLLTKGTNTLSSSQPLRPHSRMRGTNTLSALPLDEWYQYPFRFTTLSASLSDEKYQHPFGLTLAQVIPIPFRPHL
ncbi:uncharacterized protein LOC113852153 [Abrus precatorius]|uniref:Uncharacterized protein LOC113852153 n=1 Tax=Abrus precatorius TaxID=3816 RepID=A0A8B8K398_ABRPR|nr:uncharacterized protein LOC113852153 [Abrus precatorius]